MEPCPLCGRDTPCTTTGNEEVRMRSHPRIAYRCLECWIEWRPNQAYQWRPWGDHFDARDLIGRGIVPTWT